MRVQHGDKIVAGRRPPGQAAAADSGSVAESKPSRSKKRKARAGSDDSMFGGGGAGDDDFLGGGGGGGDGTGADGLDGEEFPAFSADEVRACNEHPHLATHFVAHVVVKAKYAYCLREYEEMANEYEALVARENELQMEKDQLVAAILRKEVACVSTLFSLFLLSAVTTRADSRGLMHTTQSDGGCGRQAGA
jgi:hypothetical protein